MARLVAEEVLVSKEVDRGDILIVDDEPDIVTFLSAVLTDEGFPVRTARNGREGLGAIRSQQPSLLILDLMMPEISGFEVLDTLREEGLLGAIPIIVLSAKSSHSDILDALHRGADDFIPKPFDLDELLLRIRVWMNRTKAAATGVDTVKVHALAPFRVSMGDSTLIDEETGDPKTRFILKYLITNPNQNVDRESLLYMTWPDLDRAVAAKEFDDRLGALRKLLRSDLPGHQYLVEEGESLRLDTEQDYWCDADEFEAQVRLASHAQEAGEMDAALGTFLNALSVYNQDFLHENLYEDWPSERREKLRELWISAMFRSGAICADRCEFSDSIRFMKRVLDADPYRENAYQALMLYLTRAGRRSEAIQLYRYAERLFAQHLAAQPAPSTRMLYEKILRGEAG